MATYTSTHTAVAFLLIGRAYIRVDSIESFTDEGDDVLVNTISGSTYREPDTKLSEFADRIRAALNGEETY